MAITIENEGLCPRIITDEVHAPPSAIPFSVPVVIDVKESGSSVFEPSGNCTLPRGGVIDTDGVRAKAIQVQVHGGCAKL